MKIFNNKLFKGVLSICIAFSIVMPAQASSSKNVNSRISDVNEQKKKDRKSVV